MKFTEGELQFTGETHTAEGLKVLPPHDRWHPKARERAQVSFASRDGTTWKPHYELLLLQPVTATFTKRRSTMSLGIAFA